MATEEKKGLLERILGSHKKKAEANRGNLEAEVKEKLKGIVYEEELVDELTPVFMKLHGVEGFDKVFELLETKEKQIEYISGGDWFKQESEEETQEIKREDEDEEETDISLVDSILSKKYGE